MPRTLLDRMVLREVSTLSLVVIGLVAALLL
jgi:hypothetical protein